MMQIDAKDMDFRQLNETVRAAEDPDITIRNCYGQRFIGAGRACGTVTVEGVPGNALGAYLNGASITVHGNAQDAVGDTMNEGLICVHGSSGDATGYAMRGGMILVRGDAGYRAGIHMKAYREKLPVLVIGGRAGSFLGEYQAGGIIVVLGLPDVSARKYAPDAPLVGYFCGTGMHGGAIFLRCDTLPRDLPPQVLARDAGPADLETVRPYIERYADTFGCSATQILDHRFYMLTPNESNPYKRLYTHNS